MSKAWKKQGQTNVLVSKALDALKLDKKESIKLKNQAMNTLLAKQAMEEMGWKFDICKSRMDQLKNFTTCEFKG